MEHKVSSNSFLMCVPNTRTFCCSREKVNTLSLKHLIRCAKSCAVQNIPQIFHMLCHFTSHSPHHKYYSFLTLLFSISFLCISFFILFLWICCFHMHRLYKNSLSSSTKLLPTAYRMPLMFIYYFKCRW